MTEFLRYAVQGIPIGCVFGLLAVGLVLTYKTTGVFNLAFAAQAYASAAVFFVLRQTHEWPLVPAAVLAIVVVAPLLGLLLDRLLYRHLRTASPLAKLVTSLGLLVAIPQIVNLLLGLGTRPQYRPPPLWPVERVNDLVWPQRGASIAINAAEISTLLFTALIVIALAALFRWTQIGLQMRAVVESPRLLELQGVDADRASAVSWALSSLVAGFAGVLMAPLFAQMVFNDFFTLLVAALAATVFAGLVSIPRALVGGLLLGVLQAELAGFLPTDNVLTNGLRPALPFLVLFLLLVGRLVHSLTRGTSVAFAREATDPMAGVDPPPAATVGAVRPASVVRSVVIAGSTLIALILVLAVTVFDSEWTGVVLGGACLTVMMLSMVMMTGVGGTISLCQATFGAIGAFTTAQVVDRWDLPVLGAMLLGALVAAAVGAILALPVIRLPAVYAALATLAFALMFETIVRPLDAVSGGSVPVSVPRPTIGSIDFANDNNFLLLVAILAAVVAGAVVLLKRGTTGTFLSAVNGSELAAASVGINPSRQRFVAFVTAAGIAGLAGGLIAMWAGQANYEANFVFFLGLVWLAIAVTFGARSVGAAAAAGLAFYAMPKILNAVFSFPSNHLASNPGTDGLLRSLLEFPDPAWSQAVAFTLFGLGALTYARHPEGVVRYNSNRVVQKIRSPR